MIVYQKMMFSPQWLSITQERLAGNHMNFPPKGTSLSHCANLVERSLPPLAAQPLRRETANKRWNLQATADTALGLSLEKSLQDERKEKGNKIVNRVVQLRHDIWKDYQQQGLRWWAVFIQTFGRPEMQTIIRIQHTLPMSNSVWFLIKLESPSL